MLGRIIWLVLAAGAFTGSAEAQSPSPTQVTLEYRWVGGGGTAPVHRAPCATTGESDLVSDSVVLTLHGVARAEVASPAPGIEGWDVIVRLTPSATQTFGDATGGHVGHRIAVLVDGRIVQVATVGARLGRVAGVLSGVPRDSADALVARINRAVAAAVR